MGIVHTINAFLPLLRAGPTKKIVTLTSAMADFEFVHKTKILLAGPYAISKAAANMVIAKYAAELGKDGFTVVGLAPGMVNTTKGEHEVDCQMVQY